MMKKVCPHCQKEQIVKPVSENEVIQVKNLSFSYKALHYKCCLCNEVFDTEETLAVNRKSAKNAILQNA